MSEERLSKLEGIVEKIHPQVIELSASHRHINADIQEIKGKTENIFGMLGTIKECVQTMPEKLNGKVESCRSKLEDDLKEVNQQHKDEVKNTFKHYVTKEKALMPRHLYWAAFIVTATVSVIAYINTNGGKDNNSGQAASIVKMIQSGEITVNPKK